MSQDNDDYKDAEEFREGIHKEVLERARKLYPRIEKVIDPNPVDAYLLNVWDYPGKWYVYVGIPDNYRSRDALIEALVKETVDYYRKTRWFIF